MNPLDFLIPVAHAQAAGAPAASPMGGLQTFLFPIILIVIMYFLMIRPQMKRQKEAKAMVDALAKGDEIVTAGGMLAKIRNVGDSYLTVEVANGVEIQIQRTAVIQVLPKGTIK